MATGTRWNTASGVDTSFGSDTLALSQVEDLANQAQVYTIVAITAASAAPTAAQCVNAIWTVTGTSGTVTLPSAANVVAAVVNAQVGSSFEVIINNGGSGSLTFPATGTPTGYTLVGTAAVVTTASQIARFVLTNVTLGSEAYSVYMFLKTSS